MPASPAVWWNCTCSLGLNLGSGLRDMPGYVTCPRLRQLLRWACVGRRQCPLLPLLLSSQAPVPGADADGLNRVPDPASRAGSPAWDF